MMLHGINASLVSALKVAFIGEQRQPFVGPASGEAW